MKKKKVKIILSMAMVVLVSFMSLCLIHSFRYPPIARSGYWHHPILLAKATIRCAFPGRGVSKTEVLTNARQIGGIDGFNINLLYLPDKPKEDNSKDIKSMRNRVFSILAKGWLETEENLFWMASPKVHPQDGNGYTYVYEYKTGRLVCAEHLAEQLMQSYKPTPGKD
jgi:hypothetical protein